MRGGDDGDDGGGQDAGAYVGIVGSLWSTYVYERGFLHGICGLVGYVDGGLGPRRGDDGCEDDVGIVGDGLVTTNVYGDGVPSWHLRVGGLCRRGPGSPLSRG